MMQLDDLSLDDLVQLRRQIDVLAQAGRVLRDGKLDPQFSLVPGQAVSITVPALFGDPNAVSCGPEPAGLADDTPLPVAEQSCGPQASAMPQDTAGGGLGLTVPTAPAQAEEDGGAVDLRGEGRSDPRSSGGVGVGQCHVEGFEPVSPVAEAPPAVADAKPAAPVATVDPAPVAGVGSAGDRPAPSTASLPWTTDEDTQAVEIYVDALADGLSRSAAAQSVADVLDRPFFGVQFRLKNKLAAAVEAHTKVVAALEAGTVPVVPAAPPVPEPVMPVQAIPGPDCKTRADLIAVRAAPAKVPPPPAAAVTMVSSALGHHLASINRHGKYSEADDLALIDLVCTGILLAVVVDALGVNAAEVHRRRNLLRAMYKDGNGKLCGTYTNEQLLEALQARAKVGVA